MGSVSLKVRRIGVGLMSISEAGKWVRNTETRKAHILSADDIHTLCGIIITHQIYEHSPPKRNRRCQGCLTKIHEDIRNEMENRTDANVDVLEHR